MWPRVFLKSRDRHPCHLDPSQSSSPRVMPITSAMEVLQVGSGTGKVTVTGQPKTARAKAKNRVISRLLDSCLHLVIIGKRCVSNGFGNPMPPKLVYVCVIRMATIAMSMANQCPRNIFILIVTRPRNRQCWCKAVPARRSAVEAPFRKSAL